MNKESRNDEAMKELKESYKPSLLIPVLTTITCIVPYLHLLLDIVNKNYDRLINLTLISLPLIVYIILSWMKYFYDMKKYKVEIGIYLDSPENYQ